MFIDVIKSVFRIDYTYVIVYTTEHGDEHPNINNDTIVYFKYIMFLLIQKARTGECTAGSLDSI